MKILRVLCGPDVLGKFEVEVGLKQESVLSPFLFIVRDIRRELLYASCRYYGYGMRRGRRSLRPSGNVKRSVQQTLT